MRFYAILVVSSILAMVLAAPHPNRDRGTSLVERRGNQFSQQGGETPNQAAVTPSSESKPEPLHDLNIDVEKIGTDSLPRKRNGIQGGQGDQFGFFDYPLQEYNGKTDLILRDFGKNKAAFDGLRKTLGVGTTELKGVDGYEYVDSGIFYDPRNSKLPNSVAQSKTWKSMKSEKHTSYVVILQTAKQPGTSWFEERL
ncbi:hypothetical protein FB446DRAFT_787677 [Lentinula raphanica]|nr:hypothetical protein FB446DRAFT_787677 [Lentinula raphanica]